MKRGSSRRRARSGLTLVELSIGLFLFASIVLVVGFATDRSLAMLRQRRVEEEVSLGANRLVQRLAGELVFAQRAAFVPDPIAPFGSDTLTYRRPAGVVDEAVTWGPPMTLRFEYETGELDDGLDNNGNELVDEGVVVWVENEGQPGERRVVFARDVREFLAGETFNGADDNGNGIADERGLSLVADDGLLTIRVTTEGRAPSGTLITKSAETTVLVRN